MEMPLKEIERSEDMYFYTENISVASLVEDLSQYVKNKKYFHTESNRVYSGVFIDDNLSTKNLREVVCTNHTKFVNANLKDSGLAGSLFIDTEFFDCDYTNTNFQSSDFRNCVFRNATLRFTAFNRSCFMHTIFEDCEFSSASMCDCKFLSCTFKQCKWSMRMENSVLKDCRLIDVTFKNMNLEFVAFDNVHTENVKFPFPTIPFIYGGLKYLINTSDNVCISSATRKEGISRSEYLLQLPKLEQYYKATQNFFPLCNILIAKGEYSTALVCVIKGIEKSVLVRKFRMLINYYKLLKYIPIVTAHTRQELYTRLMNTVYRVNLSDFEQSALNAYLPQAVSILQRDMDAHCITLQFDTNICHTDTKRLSILYSTLDSILDGKCNYSVEIKHNSPISELVTIFSNPDNITILVSTLSMIFCGFQLIYAAKDHKAKEKTKDSPKQHSSVASPQSNVQDKPYDYVSTTNATQIFNGNNIIFNNCSIYVDGRVFVRSDSSEDKLK